MTIALPDLGERLDTFLEHRSPTDRGLVIEVAAIHEGTTANFNVYPATELAAALPSWTSPYPKPVLLHHDPESEPLGRIIGARMDKETDDTPYVRLQVAVTDTEAMKKVRDQRYLTGSVGGRAGKASCTICNADWSNASMFEAPCKHRRGKSYNGKVAGIEMADISFKEYSFVNMPADQRSGVRAVHQTVESEEAVEDFRPARFFSLDMVSEAITEFGESERDVLGGLRPQEATALFLGLKGAFLSALAEDSRQTKENGMADEMPPEVEEEEEDVLAVAEELSADLAQSAEEDGDSEGSGDEGQEGEEEAPADEPEEPAESSEEPPVVDEENEGEAGEESETSPEEEGGDSEESEETEEETPEAEGSAEESNNEPAEVVADLNARIAVLTAENEKLSDQNTRLRSALKKGLAERVVDMRIALGLSEAEQRDEIVEQHMQRTASSLADSLRDLAQMPAPVSPGSVPHVKATAAGVKGDADREVAVEVVETQSPKPLDPEDVFVDALMGRRPL
jgi:hypothetical protein